MTLKLGTGMKDVFIGQGNGTEAALEAARAAFEQGNQYALFEVVVLCACVQATVPEWATDALLAMKERLDDGRLSNLGAAFGRAVPGGTVSARARRTRLMKYESDILITLYKLRLKGHSFNDAELYVLALEHLRQLQIPVNHRDIRDVANANRASLRRLPRGPAPDGRSYGVLNLTIPLSEFRRRGRPLLNR